MVKLGHTLYIYGFIVKLKTHYNKQQQQQEKNVIISIQFPLDLIVRV